MSKPVTNSNGNAVSNGNSQSNGRVKSNGRAKPSSEARIAGSRKPAQDSDALIRQAEALRTALRDALLKTNELLKGLKRHRRFSRSVPNTLASLRSLKALGA